MSRPMTEGSQSGNTITGAELADQTQLLLTGLATMGREHLAEVAADLCQTNTLLHEAIVKLTGSFADIHQTVMAQQALVAQAPAASGAASGQLELLAQQLSQRIGEAVTGLQFQDLTSQLIQRTLARLAGLQQMLAALDAPANAMSAAQLHAQLQRHHSELSGALQKSVGQKHMESGDIELF